MSAQESIIEKIFHKALNLPDKERKKYIESSCGDDKELIARVEALLEANDKAGDFLKIHPDFQGYGPQDRIKEGPGTKIGRYRLIEIIGEGGMAVVYKAEQTQPVHREVALKIIKAGMDTKQVIARFEIERQALAIMDHPNIAKILFAGETETGRPYFVMDFVDGAAITDYCDQNSLSIQERLVLFMQVCHAVQHAHQKGIIHRDIKPSNILVTLQEGKAVPKVIDFGIAKAIKQKLTEKTLFTRYEQLIGTPEYMSPEQADGNTTDIDTRTDVYSLGVLLYQLLTGVTPFDAKTLREAGYAEIQRIIREVEPVKPSTKLSRLGEDIYDIAKHHKINPSIFCRMIHGDLDWIVMKSLDKDRTRRYETVIGFANDIQRYLNHEAVKAAAPNMLYKLRKFVRRNRAAVAVAFTIAVILIAGITLSSIGFVQASIQRNLANANFVKASSAVDGLIQVSSWNIAGASTPEVSKGQLAILTTGQEFFLDFLKDNPGDQQMLENLAKSYKKLGELHMKLNNYADAEIAYQNAREIFQQLAKDRPDRSELYNLQTACCWSGLSFAYGQQDKHELSNEARSACMTLWNLPDVKFKFGTAVNPGEPMNTESLDGTAYQTKNGLERYFGSDRGGGMGGRGDIWVSRRETINDPWLEPVNIGTTVNTETYEGKPSLTDDGLEMVFMSNRKGSVGSCDLWISTRTDVESDWGEPQRLGPTVNSKDWDGTPFLTGDGLTLYFESDRDGGLGGDDIWVTRRTDRNEQWSKPENLGPPINSQFSETDPCPTSDGLYILFGSTRPISFGGCDLWIASRNSTEEPWSKAVNLGPNINTLYMECHPKFSFGGSIMYYAVKDHPDGIGGWDMWEIPVTDIKE